MSHQEQIENTGKSKVVSIGNTPGVAEELARSAPRGFCVATHWQKKSQQL